MTTKQYVYCFLFSLLNTLLFLLFPSYVPFFLIIFPIPGFFLCLAIIGIDIYRRTFLWKPFLFIYAIGWMSYGLAICVWIISN